MPGGDDLAELLLAARHAAALAAHREGGPDDRRQGELARGEELVGLLHRLDDLVERHAQAGLLHRLAEGVAVLGPVDRVVVGADQLDAELLQGAVVVQGLGQVERGLAAERRQQRIGALLLDDPRDRRRVAAARRRSRSANSGSVMIVAGFELTRTTS